jgi:hypothetical protein
VTSASLTWNRHATPEAADYDREHPELAVQIPQVGISWLTWRRIRTIRLPLNSDVSGVRAAAALARRAPRKRFLALVKVPEKDTPAVGGINNG